MKNGVITVCDTLGFKGIWKRFNADDVLALLKELKAALLKSTRSAEDHFRNPDFPETSDILLRIKTCFLSDTLITALWIEYDERGVVEVNEGGIKIGFRPSRKPFLPEEERALLLGLACTNAVSAIVIAGDGAVKLAYRGIISVGDFLLEDDFFIGPAIDEAAALMDLPDGAFVWLSPSAREVVEFDPSAIIGKGRFEPDVWTEVRQKFNSLLLAYEVPLKTGRRIQSYVVNPFPHMWRRKRCERLLASLLGTFDRQNIDVEIKRQNTERLLREALRVRFPSLPPENRVQ